LLFVVAKVCADLLLDLYFDRLAEGVDRDHILDQADSDSTVDTADILCLQNLADDGMFRNDQIDSFFADAVGDVHVLTSFVPQLLSGEQRGNRCQTMTRVK
jgi:hypothetical protein